MLLCQAWQFQQLFSSIIWRKSFNNMTFSSEDSSTSSKPWIHEILQNNMSVLSYGPMIVYAYAYTELRYQHNLKGIMTNWQGVSVLVFSSRATTLHFYISAAMGVRRGKARGGSCPTLKNANNSISSNSIGLVFNIFPPWHGLRRKFILFHCEAYKWLKIIF